MPKKKTQSKAVRYPWDRWLKRKKFTLYQGIDYNCMTHCMSILLRNAAHRRGIQVQVFTVGDSLQVTQKGEYLA